MKNKITLFIAGHAYDSVEKNLGIYPKFYKELTKNKNIFDFGIFAGDITRNGDEESFNFFDSQIKKVKFKIYIAPGNHDIGFKNNDIKKFIKRYKNLYQSLNLKMICL